MPLNVALQSGAFVVTAKMLGSCQRHLQHPTIWLLLCLISMMFERACKSENALAFSTCMWSQPCRLPAASTKHKNDLQAAASTKRKNDLQAALCAVYPNCSCAADRCMLCYQPFKLPEEDGPDQVRMPAMIGCYLMVLSSTHHAPTLIYASHALRRFVAPSLTAGVS